MKILKIENLKKTKLLKRLLQKLQKILLAIERCLLDKQVTIRQLASVKGKLEATKPANPHAPLWVKRLEMYKVKALAQNNYNFEAKIVLDETCIEDLKMAQKLLPMVSAPIRFPPPDKLVFSDSSSEGWGIDDPVTEQKGEGQNS